MAVTWRRLAFADEIGTSTTDLIATGEVIALENNKQLIVHDNYTIEGTGELTINGSGKFLCI